MDPLIKSNNSLLRWIAGVSIAIPLVVAVLLFAPLNLSLGEQGWVKVLPAFHAIINSCTALLLISAVVAIKAGRIVLHRNLMLGALALGTIFLLSYVTYHASASSVIFGDMDHDGVLSAQEQAEVGAYRTVYLITLLSHIGFSIVVVPFVLMAFYFGLSGQYEKHRKIVKFTFPIWLYVSITGVLVYLMISPYYF